LYQPHQHIYSHVEKYANEAVDRFLFLVFPSLFYVMVTSCRAIHLNVPLLFISYGIDSFLFL